MLAGFGAGILTSSVGVASLLSFPVLLAVGIPPVVANVSNTIGLIPAGIGGAVGFRDELREEPALTRRVVVLTGIAGAAGAVLLLALPETVFEAIVPWLILGTCLLVGVQPRLSSWLAARRGGGQRYALSPTTTVFVLLTGLYGGYFGAGAGVLMIAVLALGLDVAFRVIAAIRTTSVMAANVVAGLVFAAVAHVDWLVVVLLAGGSMVGGYVGARVARRLPATLLRTLIVVAGVVAAALLWTGTV
ncbi:sulfite exporter TauE/SafE family protein [Pseudonocardia sp. CA-107938]|uniref:sulfite exporter TauE/SafE family protein n=1 Tax=Pseudonocardia sp. CA-107938 TaxID=3240021 RepID=UPI003D931B80